VTAKLLSDDAPFPDDAVAARSYLLPAKRVPLGENTHLHGRSCALFARGALAPERSETALYQKRPPFSCELSMLVPFPDDAHLSEDELFATANILMVAGHETTTNLIGNGTLALLRHPDQLRALRDDPSLLPQAVEELLRYDSPVQAIYRIATDDLEFGGQQIRKDQVVHLVLGAANRDPAHFPDPDRLDVTRPPGRHLAFGQGPHFCLGTSLARMEASIAFRALLDRFPDLRLASNEVTFRPNPSMRGLAALPLEF